MPSPMAGAWHHSSYRTVKNAGPSRSPVPRHPWIAGDYVFIIAGQRTMAAIARSNGGVRWSANLPGRGVWAGPVVAGGRLLAVSSKGKVASVSPQTGELINDVNVGEEFFISPVIANGTVYLLADNGTLIAMR